MFRKRAQRNIRRTAASRDSSDNEEPVDRNGGSAQQADVACLQATPSAASLLSFAEDVEGDEVSVKIGKKSKSRLAAKTAVKENDCDMVFVPPVAKDSAVKVSDHLHSKFSERIESVRVDRDGGVSEAIYEVEGENDEFQEILSRGCIPDATLIHKARKQRQRAREGATAPEVILFSDAAKKASTRRLVREEDDSGSDDERFKFYSRHENQSEMEMREVQHRFIAIEQGDSDDDKDGEFEKWEREQIRKGVSAQMLAYYQHGASEEASASRTGSMEETNEPLPMDLEVSQEILDYGSSAPPVFSGRRVRALPEEFYDGSTSTLSMENAFETCRAKVKQSLKDYRECHQRIMDNMARARDHLEENVQLEANLNEAKPSLMQQYQFFQSLHAYVSSLLDCLNDKVSEIDEVWLGMRGLLRQKTAYLIERAKKDISDQYDECMAFTMERASDVEDPERRVRSADREARRTRRRLARENCPSNVGYCDGLSTDDEESPTRMAEFRKNRDDIMDKALAIFEDVEEEYSTLDAVCQRFAEWYERYPAFYKEAYVILCLPKLLSPFIRLEMLEWTPTKTNHEWLADFSWFEQLLMFGSDGDASDDDDDDDIIRLIPTVVEKVVCPILKEMVEHEWLPSSSSQTKSLGSFLSHLFATYPTLTKQSKNAEALVEAIYERFKRSLSEEVFIPVFSKEIMEMKSSGAAAFTDRQFWFAVKCLRNVAFLSGVLSDYALRKLVFDCMINRHVMLCLQCKELLEEDVLTKVEAVCAAIPEHWTSDDRDRTADGKFEPLCALIAKLRANENLFSGSSAQRIAALVRRFSFSRAIQA